MEETLKTFKTKCMHCQADIYIAKIFSNSSIPVNCDPVKVEEPGKYVSITKGYIPMEVGDEHYILHSQTCPKAKETARMKYQKRRYEECVLNPILQTDLAGLMILLDKCRTLKALSERWLDPGYQISMTKLPQNEKEMLISHKNKLKEALQPAELELK